MSLFTQTNSGGGRGVQYIRKGEEHKFTQTNVNGGNGVQHVYDGEVKFQTPSDNDDQDTVFVQHVHGGIGFQSMNMTTNIRK
jgi:hypothetical protein